MTKKTVVLVILAFAACSKGGKSSPEDPVQPSTPVITRAGEPIPNQYLVVLKPGTDGVGTVASELLQSADGAWVSRDYDHVLRGFALHATEAQALAMAGDSRVSWVAEDGRVRAKALTEQKGAPAGLDRIDQRSGTDGSFKYYAGAGEGVHAYVIDTGILGEHAEFTGRMGAAQDFVGDGNTGDCNGHGTHVAGILGGTTYGVAKKVTLHSLRALGCDGAGATSDLVGALDWLVGNATLPAVVNLSLGRDPDAALDAAVQAVITAGIPVVVAAGDRNRDACNTSPARVPEALTVASTDTSGTAAAKSSNQGPCIDLLAPGVDIQSASIAPNQAVPPEYVTSVVQSGTSTSAPFVAGAVALYLGRNTAATPEAIARALFANSTRAPATIDRYTPDRFLFTTFVDDDNSADTGAPAASIDAPVAGTVVTGSDVAVSATATDDVGVTRVELFANGRFIASSTTSPYGFTWDSRREPNGVATLVVRAYDKAGNATDSATVAVTVQNEGVAHFDASLGVPKCETVAAKCDSVDLLRGRADVGPEQNAPNTLQYACPTATDPSALCRCADGPFGEYETDESIEEITVTTLLGEPLAVGSNVRVDVQLYVGSVYWDELDLYSSPTVTEPVWRYLGTLQAVASGLQTLTATFTLPDGGVQAVRAGLRYGQMPSICTEGGFDDRDDLAFAVAAGTPDTTPPTGVAITSPTKDSKVSGRFDVTATATDDHLVSRVDFMVGSTLIGSAFAEPYEVKGWNSGTVPNGNYSFKAIAYDGAGNVAESAPVPVVIKDETPPTVSITSPEDGYQVKATPVKVVVAASDNGVVKRVELWVNDDYYATDLAAPYEFSLYGGVGTYVLKAVAYDGADLATTSAPVTVLVGDTVKPTCTITSPADGATVVGQVTIKAEATDDVGVASVQFYAGATAIGLPMAAPYEATWESGLLTNGDYQLTCVATDTSGNTQASAPVKVTVADTEAPTVALTAPIGGATLSGVVTLQATAADDGAVYTVEFLIDGVVVKTQMVGPYQYDWTSGEVPNGTHVLAARATDYNGHSATSADVTVTTSDTTAPAVAIVTPWDHAIVGGSVRIRATATDDGGDVASVRLLVDEVELASLTAKPWSFTWETIAETDGDHVVRVEASDVAGNVASASVTVSVAAGETATYDPALLAPVCATERAICSSGVLLDGRGSVGSEPGAPNTIGGTCADGNSGVYGVDESIDAISVTAKSAAVLTAGTEAEVKVRAHVFDATNDVVELYYAADADGPVWTHLATLTPSTLGGTVQNFTKSYTLPFGVRQAIRASIRFDPTGTDACLPDEYTDHDDLVFAVKPANDLSPPTVAITSPVEAATVRGSVNVTATATDDTAVASVQFFLDGVLVSTSYMSPYGWSWPTQTASTGQHVLLARAWDSVGRDAWSAPVTVTVADRVAPVVALTSPLAGESVMGALTLSASATDDVGTTKVEFLVDNVLVATDTTSPFAVSWNSASVGDGTVTVRARAYDAAGNTSLSAPRTVLVSNYGNAKHDNGFKTPYCSAAATKCFSGTLLSGRGTLGPEANAPNTLGSACADGNQGSYHVDESIDAITVRSDTGTLTAGEQAIVEVKIWAGSNPAMDSLDLYTVDDPTAASPVWSWFATLPVPVAGPQVLSTTFVVPPGALQAVRAQLRYGGASDAFVCGAGTFDDRDDLVFAVN